MKKSRILAIALSSVLCLSLAACAEEPDDSGGIILEGQVFSVQSPDETTDVNLTLNDDGQLFYKVNKNGVGVVDYSSLGFIIENSSKQKTDMTQLLTYVDKTERKVEFDYTNITGKKDSVSGECNEMTVTFQADDYFMDVIFRAYNDGYTFRYNLRNDSDKSETVSVVKEKSEFALPDKSAAWAMQYVPITTGWNTLKNSFAYEEPYKSVSPSSFGGNYYAMPMIYRAGNSETYSIITESQLIGSGYYGSFLQEQTENRGSSILQTVMSPAGADNDNTVDLPFTSPWRVGIAGSMKECVESTLVEDVYDDAEYWKPDNYDELSEEEKAIYTYDWVDNSPAHWSWLKYPNDSANMELHYESLELAEKMGWTYLVIDGGWVDNFKDNRAGWEAFTAAAHAKGIKILGWCNSLNDFGSETMLKYTLKRWHDSGLDGLKIDFWDGQFTEPALHQGEDKGNIEWYEKIYQECAKLKMVVSRHGCNKPTGERRVYPNVINSEAIFGGEMGGGVSADKTVNSMFARNVVGPVDFTPTVNPVGSFSKAHSMALAPLYECGVNVMADYANVYLNDDDIKEFYKDVPALRKDTKFLGGTPDNYYCAAVQKSDDIWYVGGIAAFRSPTVEVDYSFLGDGEWEALIFTDVEGDRFQTGVARKTVTKASCDSFELKSSGGFAIKLTKKQ